MPQYEYLTCDLLTNEPLADLELYGTYFERNLAATGQGTGTFRLGTNIFNDELIVNSTIPGRTALYVYRDGVCIWGGIIWQRTYSSVGKTAQINCLTFESIFQAFEIKTDYIVTQVDQIQILKQLIGKMQNQPNCDVGLNTDLLRDLTSGVLRDYTVKSFDYVFYGDVINNLMEAADSFDYTIVVEDPNNTGRPDKIVMAGYPQLIPPGTQALAFDYPGNVDQYWVTDNASDAAATVIALGAGTGSAMIRAIATNKPWLDSGGPNIAHVESRTDVKDQKIISSIAQQKAAQLAPPILVPVVQLKSDRVPQFEDWSSLGGTFSVNITDCRFPNGTKVNSRMIGWQLSPASSEQTEVLKFVIEGGDLADGAV
jgi:hypothetical protein